MIRAMTWLVERIPEPLKYNDAFAWVVRSALRLRAARLEKLIFSATTGRSGTKALAALFARIPDCISLHEPNPCMNGEVLRAAAYGDSGRVERAYRQRKSLRIWQAAFRHRYYVEINHLFIKTFASLALEEFGDRVRIIHLVRPPIDVATSIFCLEEVPGTTAGNDWWLDHRAPTNQIRIAEVLDTDRRFTHPFYRALWYWYEIEQRISTWRRRLPAGQFVRFETGWLNEPARVFALFDALNLPYSPPPILEQVGARIHAREYHKRSAAIPADLATDMHHRFQRLLLDRGVDVSALSALAA